MCESRPNAWLLFCPTAPARHLSSTHYLQHYVPILACHILQLPILHSVSVVIPLTIYVPICFSAFGEMSVQPTTHLGILLQLLFWKVEHMFRVRSPTFSLTTFDDEYVFLSLEIAPNFDGHYHCWLNLHIYGVVNINNDNTCNNDGCLGENTIIHRTIIRWWFHSLCYWDIWVFSFPFWVIFNHLCTYHYCASLVAFFSPFDTCFLLLIVRVHSLTTCANHNDFFMGYNTWLRFFISSTHHS
jgi:hypothetical protein